MAKGLNQLYFEATGLTQVNVEKIVADIKSGVIKNSLEQISRLMWYIPGGTSNKGVEFKAALELALSGVDAPTIAPTPAVTDAPTIAPTVDDDELIENEDDEVIDENNSTAEVVADIEDEE